MPEKPRDYETELWTIMDALSESLAEASDEDVFLEVRNGKESPHTAANRVRNVLKHAAQNDEQRRLRGPLSGQTNRFVLEAESDTVAELELSFATKSLRLLCESEASATRELGASVAQKLRRRVADLRAATSVKDLVAGRPHQLAGAHRQHVSVDLCEDSSIVFSPNHRTIPTLASGGVDWSKVTRVKVLRIERNDAA
jgi:plasmid maintenance system killer protein